MHVKRFLDIVISFLGLLLMSPILFLSILMIYLQDFHSPLYIAPRVGRYGKPFRMIKLRSMVVNADATGVDSTASDDMRITRVGRLVRKYKIDELSQLCNVLRGEMSLVGPRPNDQRDVDLYTNEEKKLLCVSPGITDFASIVFADESEILEGSDDPDLKYNQVIRPWKSRLGLFYIQKYNLLLDLFIILLTLVSIFSRPAALRGVVFVLTKLGADKQLIQVANRNSLLLPYPPPGSDCIVESRGLNR